MVHALKEAWRVLVPGGTMIDVRPLSLLIPLEIVNVDGKELAGMVDNTPDQYLDLAADQAIDSVCQLGKFTPDKLVLFDYALYWRTVHGMLADFDERWQGEIVISAEVIEKARMLTKQRGPKASLKMTMQMKLGLYTKKG